ncbi:terminase large subunit [Rhodobacter phage RcMotherGoose]|nr:terminase large subunit [Rhodobacter phage RcMotherGoose]
MLDLSTNFKTVWRAIPGTSQQMAFESDCDHTLYTGTRGPGKTDAQLMKFRDGVGQGYGPFWRGIILDREYKNLDDLISKSRRWFPEFNDGAKFLSSTSALKWVWPTGEELLFRSADKEQDYWQFHGHEYPFLGWNELTKYPTADLYDMFMSTNRTSFRPEDYPVYIDRVILRDYGKQVQIHRKHKNAVPMLLPEIKLQVFSTTNPYGPGHNWVKRRFIDPAPYGEVITTSIEVIDPKTKEKATVKKRQVAIFGSYTENIYLTKEYIATLSQEKDKNRRKAWLTGSWDIIAGGALDDVWQASKHVLPRFVIPPSWKIDRAFDDGSSHPFAVGWFAEADGTEADVLNRATGQWEKFCPAPKSIIQFFEWYGSEIDEQTGQPSIGTNKGLKLSARNIAKGIVEREVSLMVNGWISEQPKPGPADNRIRNVIDKELETTEDIMKKEGVKWESSDKSPGSRIVGLQLLRDRLEASLTGEDPGFYVMENCRATIALLPVLPRDSKKPDDVDTSAEDHPYDMIRYRVLKGSNRLAAKVKMTLPT